MEADEELSPSPHADNKKVGIKSKPILILDLINICLRDKFDTSRSPPQAVTNNGRDKNIFLFIVHTEIFKEANLIMTFCSL